LLLRAGSTGTVDRNNDIAQSTSIFDCDKVNRMNRAADGRATWSLVPTRAKQRCAMLGARAASSAMYINSVRNADHKKHTGCRTKAHSWFQLFSDE
jgi:hypothetical protein